jgi:acyl-CoA carboxylase subunit beta
MNPTMLAAPIRSTLDTTSENFTKNRATCSSSSPSSTSPARRGRGRRRPRAGWSGCGPRGKLPVRERIANVLDPDTPFLEISPLAAYDSDYTIGGGMVIGIGVIAGTECVILANDPSVLGGSAHPLRGQEVERALEIARDNRMPYVSFVESAGADLRVETDGGGGAPGPGRPLRRDRPLLLRADRAVEAGDPHRVRGVRLLHRRWRLPARPVRLHIVVKEQSKIFLAGPPLVKMATGEESDDETLGGADLHAEVSGLGRLLRRRRDGRHPPVPRGGLSTSTGARPGPPVAAPRRAGHDPEELLGLVSRDLKQPVDVRDVVARVVDGSRFEEFKPRYGPRWCAAGPRSTATPSASSATTA